MSTLPLTSTEDHPSPLLLSHLTKDLVRHVFGFLSWDDVFLLFRVFVRHGDKHIEEPVQLIEESLGAWKRRLEGHAQLCASLHVFKTATLSGSAASEHKEHLENMIVSSTTKFHFGSVATPLPSPSYSCLVYEDKCRHRHMLYEGVDPPGQLLLKCAWAEPVAQQHVKVWSAVFEAMFPILCKSRLYPDSDDEDEALSLLSYNSDIPVMSSSPLQDPLVVDFKSMIAQSGSEARMEKRMAKPEFPRLVTSNVLTFKGLPVHKMVDLVHLYYNEVSPKRWIQVSRVKDATHVIPLNFVVVGSRESGLDVAVRKFFSSRPTPNHASAPLPALIYLHDRCDKSMFLKININYVLDSSANLNVLKDADAVFMVFSYNKAQTLQALVRVMTTPAFQSLAKTRNQSSRPLLYMMGTEADRVREVDVARAMHLAQSEEASFFELAASPDSPSPSCRHAMATVLYQILIMNQDVLERSETEVPVQPAPCALGSMQEALGDGQARHRFKLKKRIRQLKQDKCSVM